MKRILIITIYLLTALHYINAVQSYPTYSGVKPLWVQSATESRTAAKPNYVLHESASTFQSVNRGSLYLHSSATSRVAGNSYRGIHSTIHSVGASGVSIMSNTFVSQSTPLYSPKFSPPSTGDEEEPDPTKIVPIKDGTIFVLFLLLIYMIIKIHNHETKFLSRHSFGRHFYLYASQVFRSLRRSFQQC